MKPNESADSGAMQWAEKVADLAADALLLHANVIDADQYNDSVEIIREEILAGIACDKQ